MARVKYYYDPETCTYKRVKIKKLDIFLNLLGFLTLSLIMGILIAFFTAQYFQDAEKSKLRAENEELKVYYDILGKKVNELDEIMANLQDRDDNIYRVIFEAEPIPNSIRSAGAGGVDRYQDLISKGLKEADLVIGSLKKIDDVKRKMYIQSKSYDEIVQLVKEKSKLLAHTPAIQPISNKQLTRLTSGFGLRIHPIYKVGQFHPGIDFAAPYGTPIYATADGVVSKSLYESGYGNHIVIDHGYGYKTLYGHMSEMAVQKGEKVKRGQLIGYVGSTGFSTAPHVHYEVIYKGEQVNPVYFFFQDLGAEEYEKILQLASIENQSLS
ncbi:MAG: peptidoglycan DD-metalloendopeptidase family protein [Microscillaceae bacterium]|nr:peptidoglycan DD-metalloendopeptidase family protein [Microscillaceae bacterium]